MFVKNGNESSSNQRASINENNINNISQNETKLPWRDETEFSHLKLNWITNNEPVRKGVTNSELLQQISLKCEKTKTNNAKSENMQLIRKSTNLSSTSQYKSEISSKNKSLSGSKRSSYMNRNYKFTNDEMFRCVTIRDKVDDSGTESDSDFENVSKWIILPQNEAKQSWDLFIGVLLIFTSLVTPFRISFIDDSKSANSVFDYVDLGIDVFFLADIVLNFFFAYYNSEEKIETKMNKIAFNYLKGWFIIDFISVFPLNLIIDKGFTTSSSTRVSNTIMRFAKIPKWYKWVKLMKLWRMIKVVKKKNVTKLTRSVLDQFRVNIHLERLIYYILGLLLFIHLSGCAYYFIAKLEDFHPNTWVTRLGLIDEDPFYLYIMSFYWSLATITTVGYGDISSSTTAERVYNWFIMSFGVVMYSFSIGYLSEVVATIDKKTSEMNTKLQALYQIKQEYDIDDEIYDKVRKLVKYDWTNSQRQRNLFLNELPNKLKWELSRWIHDNVIKKLIFFQDKLEWINFVAPLLKSMRYSQNENIYNVGDTPDESK